MGSSFADLEKGNILGEWQKNTDERWQWCWQPLRSCSRPSVKPCFMFCLLALFSYIYGTDVRVKMRSEYDVYGNLAVSFWRPVRVGSFPALAHCLPFGRVHKTVQMESAGTCYKWFGAELDRCGSAGLRALRVAVISEGKVVRIPFVWGILQLRLFTSRPRVEVKGLEPQEGVWLMSARRERLRDATSRRAARRVEAARAGPGAWRKRKTCQTSRRGSQQHLPPGDSCVCPTESWTRGWGVGLLDAYVIQALKRRSRFPHVHLKTEHREQLQVGVLCELLHLHHFP